MIERYENQEHFVAGAVAASLLWGIVVMLLVIGIMA